MIKVIKPKWVYFRCLSEQAKQMKELFDFNGLKVSIEDYTPILEEIDENEFVNFVVELFCAESEGLNG